VKDDLEKEGEKEGYSWYVVCGTVITSNRLMYTMIVVVVAVVEMRCRRREVGGGGGGWH
jgi:hypothetical protein